MKLCPFYYIAKAGIKPVLAFFIIFILSLFTSWWPFWLLVLIIAAFIYKNPHKQLSNPDELAILAPISGKITAIEKIDYKNLGSCLEIRILNSLCDSGVLRGFKTCKLSQIINKKGLFLCPKMPQARRLNERQILISKESGVAVRILAGGFGRHLRLKQDLFLSQGEELGFLYSGEVSVILPAKSSLRINIGEKVKAMDLLAYLPLAINERQ